MARRLITRQVIEGYDVVVVDEDGSTSVMRYAGEIVGNKQAELRRFAKANGGISAAILREVSTVKAIPYDLFAANAKPLSFFKESNPAKNQKESNTKKVSKEEKVNA